MMIIILLCLYFVQATSIVQVHIPGAWSAAGHGHTPVLVSASEYFGNTNILKCPSYFIHLNSSLHFTYYSRVDPSLTHFHTLAPND